MYCAVHMVHITCTQAFLACRIVGAWGWAPKLQWATAAPMGPGAAGRARGAPRSAIGHRDAAAEPGADRRGVGGATAESPTKVK